MMMHGQLSPDDGRALRSIPPARVALIKKICSAARGRDRRQFLQGYFHGVGEEDLTSRAAGALAAAALHHLEFGSARRAPGQSLVKVFNPEQAREGFESPHTLVMIVTDDKPFLVESVGIV